MLELNNVINNYFDMFKHTEKELLISDYLCSIVIKSLTPIEKVFFILSVVYALKLQEICDLLGITYRQAQYYRKKVTEKVKQEAVDLNV